MLIYRRTGLMVIVALVAYCFILRFLMMLLWLLSRKNIFGRRSGYFGLGKLLILEVPELCLCLILRLHFFVLKIVF